MRCLSANREAFSLLVIRSIPPRIAQPSTPMPMASIIFEINGNDRLVLPFDTRRTEAELIQLAQQEAERHHVSLADVNIRFALDGGPTRANDPQKS